MRQIGEAIASSRKAIVALVAGCIIAYVGRKGYTLDIDTQTALRVLLDGVLAGAAVWLTSNRTK